ncbi:MAG: ribonuclease III [Clostridia bacterium]|nr:ribonuclease III [Clostridia bacterium]
MDTIEVRRKFSPLALAYEGDAVYELLVRTHLLTHGDGTVNTLHKQASTFVSAAAQSAFMEHLEPLLSEEELEIYHRGRNAKSHSRPKNADMIVYRRATGFEALFGFLHLCGREERTRELFEEILALEKERKK